jgi:hypothetical protein
MDPADEVEGQRDDFDEQRSRTSQSRTWMWRMVKRQHISKAGAEKRMVAKYTWSDRTRLRHMKWGCTASSVFESEGKRQVRPRQLL